VVAAGQTDLIDTLVGEYGYQATPARFCGKSLVILEVPG
jgi:hypothetical protein